MSAFLQGAKSSISFVLWDESGHVMEAAINIKGINYRQQLSKPCF